ncbi:single-stranded DNA-binding protein [Streptomyces marianii]
MVTLVGNVATAVEYRESAAGGRARFRFAVPSRRWDRQRDGWTDGPTGFYTVWAWRALGANLAASVAVGEPLVVHGRLRVREEEWEGKLRTSVDVDAVAAGHDLTRGTSAFRRVTRTERQPTGRQSAAAGAMAPPPAMPSGVPLPATAPTAPTAPTAATAATAPANSTLPGPSAVPAVVAQRASAALPASPTAPGEADPFCAGSPGSAGRARGRSRAASATAAVTGGMRSAEAAGSLPASARSGPARTPGSTPGARSAAEVGVP